MPFHNTALISQACEPTELKCLVGSVNSLVNLNYSSYSDSEWKFSVENPFLIYYQATSSPNTSVKSFLNTVVKTTIKQKPQQIKPSKRLLDLTVLEDMEFLIFELLNKYGETEMDIGLKLLSCHSDLFLKCRDCGSYDYTTTSCNVRVCPECNKKRFGLLYSKYIDILNYVDSNSVIPYTRNDFRLITLTVENEKELTTEVIKKFRVSLSKFVRVATKKGYIAGGIYTIEMPTGRDGYWNMHAHLLVAGKYIPQGLVSNLWLKISGYGVVDIRKADMRSLKQIISYTNKQVKLTVDNCVTYLRAVKGVKLTQAFGILYNVDIPRPYRFNSKKRRCSMCGSSNVGKVFETDIPKEISRFGIKIRSRYFHKYGFTINELLLSYAPSKVSVPPPVVSNQIKKIHKKVTERSVCHICTIKSDNR